MIRNFWCIYVSNNMIDLYIKSGYFVAPISLYLYYHLSNWLESYLSVNSTFSRQVTNLYSPSLFNFHAHDILLPMNLTNLSLLPYLS